VPEDGGEYKTQCSDYDAIKTRFQEIFELGPRSLVLPASLANIAIRGDVREYGDGRRRSLGQALEKTGAARETWLADLHASKALHEDRARDAQLDRPPVGQL
jgi:hypothetical protein